jgi:Immunity protein 27
MPIDPGEKAIRGSWTMVDGRMVADEVCGRINSLVESELHQVATSSGGWEKLYRDPVDGRYWELTYPQGGLQGGGPQALVLIEAGRARERYGIAI